MMFWVAQFKRIQGFSLLCKDYPWLLNPVAITTALSLITVIHDEMLGKNISKYIKISYQEISCKSEITWKEINGMFEV